jgi:hypothetical protein
MGSVTSLYTFELIMNNPVVRAVSSGEGKTGLLDVGNFIMLHKPHE